MPSLKHEALVELFRANPGFAAELLNSLRAVDVPAFSDIQLDSENQSDLVPTEFRADAVVTFTDMDKPVFSVVVEVQRRRDPRKLRSWPVYVATMHARHGCPVELLVICPSKESARWCGQKINVNSSGFSLTPQVVDPSMLPVVWDQKDAEEWPELALFSALTHSEDEDAVIPMLDVLAPVLQQLGDPKLGVYTDILNALLPDKAREHWREIMSLTMETYKGPYSPEFKFVYRKGLSEGEARGEAHAILTVLATRGITPAPDIVQRISNCADSMQLEQWLARAVTATTVDDLFR